jgi:hypothetical protein
MTSGSSLSSTNLPPTGIFPSRVNQLSTARIAYKTSATPYFFSNGLPGSAILKTRQGNQVCSSLLPVPYSLLLWCTGEDSNLRNSNEWQIYSLLPLTARPPVPKRPKNDRPVFRGPAFHPGFRVPQSKLSLVETISPVEQLHFHSPPNPLPRIPALPENLRLVGACTSVGSPQRTEPAKNFISPDLQTCCRPSFRIVSKWSWRRDLNPRPSDYKSDALPAELRQPDHPQDFAGNTGNPRTHSRSAHNTAQNERLAHRKRRSKPPTARKNYRFPLSLEHDAPFALLPFQTLSRSLISPPGHRRQTRSRHSSAASGKGSSHRVSRPSSRGSQLTTPASDLRQDALKPQTNESETPKRLTTLSGWGTLLAGSNQSKEVL